MPTAPDSPAPPWLEALDAALVARLRRPLDGAGIIPLSLANRILGWVGYFSGRLPLLDEARRRHGLRGSLRAGDVPIVHARLVPPPAEGLAIAPVVVERVVVRPSPPAPEAPGQGAIPAERPAVLAQRSAPVPERRDAPAPASSAAFVRPASSAEPALPPAVRANSVVTTAAEAPESRGPIASPIAARATRAPIAPSTPPADRAASAPSTSPRVVVRAGESGQSAPAARPIEGPRSDALGPRVRPIGRARGAASETSSPARPQIVTTPASGRAARTPSPVVEAFEERSRPRSAPGISATDAPPRSPLPRVTPAARTAPDAAASPASSLPHVHPAGARAPGLAAEGVAPRTPGDAAPEGVPWAATSPVLSVAALPHGHAGSEPPKVRPAIPSDPSPAAAPRAAAPIDVDDLVDKVQRKLMRRIAAERERKGGLG